MRAHSKVSNNHTLVVIENMHKEVIVILDDKEYNCVLPYAETLKKLNGDKLNVGDFCMVHDI